jgi:hypothetical protein
LVASRAQRLGQGDTIVDGPEVGVEQAGLFGQGVVVYLDHVDAAPAQGLNDLLDLGAGHHEVTVDRGLATTHGLEVDPSGDPGGRG